MYYVSGMCEIKLIYFGIMRNDVRRSFFFSLPSGRLYYLFISFGCTFGTGTFTFCIRRWQRTFHRVLRRVWSVIAGTVLVFLACHHAWVRLNWDASNREWGMGREGLSALGFFHSIQIEHALSRDGRRTAKGDESNSIVSIKWWLTVWAKQNN